MDQHPLDMESLKCYAESHQILSPQERNYLTNHSNIKNLLHREPHKMILKRIDLTELQDRIQMQSKQHEIKKKIRLRVI